MTIWQADFYKYPSSNIEQNIDWELLICDEKGKVIVQENCLQSQVNSAWLVNQLLPLIGKEKPEKIQVFRPQSLNLLTLASKKIKHPHRSNPPYFSPQKNINPTSSRLAKFSQVRPAAPLAFTRKSLG